MFNRCNKPFVVTILFGLVIMLFAQKPDTLWTKTYGGGDPEEPYSVIQTQDLGYCIVGCTKSFGHGDWDVYVVRTDYRGETLWTKALGGPNIDVGFSVFQNPDSGFVITGITNSFRAVEDDIYMCKLDSEGNTVWERTFGDLGQDRVYSISPTEDSGFILAGSVRSFGAQTTDMYLLKVDFEGNLVWEKTYGGAGDDVASSICASSDGSYVITGFTGESDALPNGNLCVLKIDTLGDTLWSKILVQNNNSQGNSVCQTSDEGYIVSGWTGTSFIDTDCDVLVVKIDKDGEVLWIKTYGEDSRDIGFTNCSTDDGGCLVGAFSSSLGTGDDDFWLLKIEGSGDTSWSARYGGSSGEWTHCVKRTSDGGYVVTGITSSYGAGETDFWLVKMKPLLEINTPNGGEGLFSGSTQTIEWWFENSPSQPYFIRLLFSNNGGLSFPDTVASNIDPLKNTYEWTVPVITSTDCLLKVELVDPYGNVIAEDKSDDVFSVAGITEEIQPSILTLQASINHLAYEVSGQALLTIYSANGRKVLTETLKDKGVWEASDVIPQGIYFAWIELGRLSQTTRVLILR
ncbi:hypothetical protein JXM67_03515 [candidate division WOR-3 bacterium]|nr:hypothetical protein [candidate division WOR-3 bacterium]